MADITAAMVKELRDRTGAGMMDCKKALTETDGDVEKAVELLRVRLGDKALKLGGRETSEGTVQAYIHSNAKGASPDPAPPATDQTPDPAVPLPDDQTEEPIPTQTAETETQEQSA